MEKSKKITVLGYDIQPGKSYEFNFLVARLHTNTPVQIPVLVERAKTDGPVLLLMAGLHGDEINGVEIIRQLIRRKYNKPNAGTIICIPIFNIFGFLNLKRELPDGRDLNRSFPGSVSGSLASQFAYHFMKDIAPVVDYVVDFHTGSAQRSNYPQIRCAFKDTTAVELAKVFNPPFIIHSSYIAKSVREAMHKIGKKILLFEGGKTNSIDDNVVKEGLEGVKRLIDHLGMRSFRADFDSVNRKPIFIGETRWLRAPQSGMLKVFIQNGIAVKEGELLAVVADPFGKLERKIKAPVDGFVFCINEAPIVNKGDALFHIGEVSTEFENEN